MKKKNIPNIITCIRLILIIPILYTLLAQAYKPAFLFFMLASLSDGLDGYLARHFHWTSKFGAFADPLADKLLMLVTYLCIAYLELLPWWVVAIVICRDLIIMLGVVIYRFLIEEPKFSASFVSKVNTTLQLLLVVGILFTEAFAIVPVRISAFIIHSLIYIVLITTLASLIDYVWVWGNRAIKVKRQQQWQ